MDAFPPPDPGSLDLDRQVEALCDRFENEWSAGRSPVIEGYLARIDKAARPLLLSELLRLEVAARRRAGQQPRAAEYRSRFPHSEPWWDALLAELFPTDSAFRVVLTVSAGPHRGRSFSFAEHDTFVVGRADDAHFSLPKDDYFSRNHFLVEVNPPLCRLLDLGSKNGTEVNGQFIKAPVNLSNGDKIRGGQTELEVKLEGPAGADVTRTLTPTAAPTASPPILTATGLPAIPGYRMKLELGRGGMGVVYKAVREADGAAVAVKTILPAMAPTPETVGRFLREAEILKQLQHPRIVPFRDMGQAGDLLYFAMDFIPGADAGCILKHEKPLAVGRVVRLLRQVLEGLAYAHGRGFVHRDVKPANMLVTVVGGREEVRLADFGLARTYQASQLSGLTMAGATAGSPPFMAPEQVLDFRSVKPPADQYSAAATLYTLLTGEHVHGRIGTIAEAFQKILQAEPTPIQHRRPDIPDGLSAAVHRALARKPEDRFLDIEAFRRALLPFELAN